MLFNNPTISIESLPAAEQVVFRSLSPRYLQVRYWSSSLVSLFLLIAIFIFLTLSENWGLIWLSLGLGIFWLVFTVLSLALVRSLYRAEGYALRARDILHRKGIIWKVESIVPFNRVQHVEVRQGPIEKIFDLCTLKIYTAGGQSSDLSVAGITEIEAQQLKAFIIQKTDVDEEE